MIFATAIRGEPTVVQFLAHPGRARNKRPLIATIQRVVADHFKIDPALMKSDRRDWVTARQRQIAMYLARELTGHSLPTIGKMFGNRDHTTVMHAIRSVEKRVCKSVEIAEDVEWLRQRLSA